MDGATQMALDEILLGEVRDSAAFRDYRWAEPCTSIGYFGISSELLTIDESKPLRSLVRRPTGGGAVDHGTGRDFTYSIVVSAEEMRGAGLAPRESYRAIHRVLADALGEIGIPAVMTGADLPGAGGSACFANPVAADVLVAGEKIAGAGQKRSRGALLHQGSVQRVDLPEAFGFEFARRLAKTVVREKLGAEIIEHAQTLAEEKYRTDAWNRRR